MGEPVQTIYDNWGNRASAYEPTLVSKDDDGHVTERTFRVGGYSIAVPTDPTQPAKVASLYNRWGASANPMPNLSFSEGEMRIPVEDFVDLILRRVPAEELAEGLWRDETVRERFVYCMANRYAGPVDDADRRKLLDAIQVEIRAVAIDRVIDRLNNLETELRAKSHRSRWEQAQLGHYTTLYERYVATLYELEEAGKLDVDGRSRRLSLFSTPDALKQYIDSDADPITRESVGAQWNESRDYWRKRLEEAFPEPAEPPPAAEVIT